jgi:outer membrane protein OmpA-like peptidoglycan-associated protein
MSARSWCAVLLLVGAADIAVINLAVGPRLVPEEPLVAAVEAIAARRPLAVAAAPAAEPAAPAIERAPAAAAAAPAAAAPALPADPEPIEMAAAEPPEPTPAPEPPPAPEPTPAPAPPPAPEPTPAPAPAPVQARTPPLAVDDGAAPPAEPTIIYFATDRATLWPAAQARLDDIAATLSAHPTWGLLVAGHADARGTDDHNVHLSERRVRRVREYLATRGIAEDRIQGRAFGERQPIADDDGDTTALHRNRRVEITFTRRDP